MNLRSLALVGLAFLLLAPSVLSLHSKDDGVTTTDTGPRNLYVPLASAIWWTHNSIRGVPTGLEERTDSFEVNNAGLADVIVTAEAFPINTPDTPKTCLPTSTPTVFPPVAGTAILHPLSCIKENGYSVHIHYFPWELGANDPDHVISIGLGTPLATTAWRVDAVPLSYKVAVLPPGHWTVWIDPVVSPSEYNIRWQATSSTPFYFDYLGTRGCPFHVQSLGPGIDDGSVLGCPNGFV